MRAYQDDFNFWQETKVPTYLAKKHTAEYKELSKCADFGQPNNDAKITAAGRGAVTRHPAMLNHVN